MKTPLLSLARIVAFWISLVAFLHAEKEALSTSAFSSAYLGKLESIVGKISITDGSTLNKEGSFFFTSIAPTFKLGLDPETASNTVFDDGKNGPMSLLVFRSPPKLLQSIGGLDILFASGILISKVPHRYVCRANGDHFALLLSEGKKIPVDSQAVLTLHEMFLHSGPGESKE